MDASLTCAKLFLHMFKTEKHLERERQALFPLKGEGQGTDADDERVPCKLTEKDKNRSYFYCFQLLNLRSFIPMQTLVLSRDLLCFIQLRNKDLLPRGWDACDIDGISPNRFFWRQVSGCIQVCPWKHMLLLETVIILALKIKLKQNYDTFTHSY